MRKLLFLGCMIAGWSVTVLGQQRVTFRVDMQHQTLTTPVRLTGDFAGWYDGKLEMDDTDQDGIYEITLDLLPGLYEYKFLKGNWSGTEQLASASAKYCTKSANGFTNRIVQVGQSDVVLPAVCFDSCMACGTTTPPANVAVTFQVDMAALGTGTTYVTGNSLDNWCGNCILMSDGNNDLIYEATQLLAPGMHEFKYTRNGWTNGESFNPGEPCTVTNFNFTNRSLFVPMGAPSVTVPASPFNGCAPHEVNLYLEVDMNDLTVDPAGVFVAGNFNNWSTTATRMKDLGHGIWGVNVVATAGDTVRYHFLNGSNAESVPATCADGTNQRQQIVPDEMPRMPATCFGQCGPCQDALNLVWSDEFDGPAIDTSKWNFDVGNGAGGWGNNELQFYTPNPTNARLLSGNLEIIALRENLAGYSYTSSRMVTRAKADFTYGRIEASIKAPQGQGIWPAFWLLPTDQVYGGWPTSGEIDVFELIGSNPDRMHGTIHYGPAPGSGHFMDGSSYDLPGSSDYADGFHVYAIEWEPNEIRWYMDTVLYHSVSPWDLYPCEWPFDQDMHILLNVAVGGYWPGYPDASTQFPQTMTVEYVRVYGSGPVATPELHSIVQPRIHPNPSSGEFFIDLGANPAKPVPIEVLDLNGRHVKAPATVNSRRTMIDLGSQAPGIYFLRVGSGTSSFVQKLIKVD